VARPLHLAQEPACDQEGRGQVRAQCLLPALEWELPDGHVLARPHARDGDADVDPSERGTRFLEQPVDFVLHGEIGLRHGCPAQLLCDGACALIAAVVVDEHARALACERPRAGRADPAGRPGHEHSLFREPGVDAA
jgi:hypothetical protein